jgi:SAM-dependent methyltransferase
VSAEATGDARTAAAFATSWNHVGEGSVYTREQFEDWFRPLDPAEFKDKSVLELGFGNGSLLYHAAAYGPARLAGVELGDTLARTRENLAHLPPGVLDLHQGDLTKVDVGEFDFVYCIGVLHHLGSPDDGWRAVLRHTRPGGRFHCWVYAREGNDVVVHVVDPVRKVASRLPWWLTKYGVALPLTVPYFVYAKALGHVPSSVAARLPLGTYSQWIAQRSFGFFHHVAFDQLVTPETHYIPRATVDRWLDSPEVAHGTAYVRRRNGNSWTFGGQKRGP